MKQAPRPRHQLQGPRDTGEEQQAYGEEGNDQQWSIAILEEGRARQTEESCSEEIGREQLHQ